RWRPAAVPGIELRDARDEAGAARGPPRAQAARRVRRLRASAAPEHHDQTRPGRGGVAATPSGGALGSLRIAAMASWTLDNRGVTAPSPTDRSRFPHPGLVRLRLSKIGWTTAGAGVLVVFLAVGF